MTAPARRSALTALDPIRPIVARLDPSRHAEDVAADIVEAWNGVETALRSLAGGSSLAGQALIRELRQREMLSLAEGHTLLDFLAARDRAAKPGYVPTAGDIAAVRAGFHTLEANLTKDPAAASAAAAGAVAGATAPMSPLPPSGVVPADTGARGMGAGGIIMIAVLVLVLGVGAFFGYQSFNNADRWVDKGRTAYAQGDKATALQDFQTALQKDNQNVDAHIYMGRIYREQNNLFAAGNELKQALTIAPTNALALREMGSYLLATNNPELARRFYIRAVQAAPTDLASQGFLGCALMRLGRTAEAMRWLQRAGNGPWSSCAMAQPPINPQAPLTR